MNGRVKARLAKGISAGLKYLVTFNQNLFCRLKKVSLFPALVLLLFLLSLVGPVYSFVRLPSKEQMTVRIIGTKNFGEEIVFDRKIEVRVGATAGEALEQAAKIEMAGSYIETIEGIKGDQTEYWFYYLNGVMANVFAHSYKLYPGDIQHWDFHDWTSYVMGPSAMIGFFPEPCLHGYKGRVVPTTVVYAQGFDEEAQRLKNKLLNYGVQNVQVKEMSALTVNEKESHNLFLIGLASSPLIKELNQVFQEREVIYFAHNEIIIRNYKGKTGTTYGSGYGILQAAQNPWNPKGSLACEGMVAVISGIDEPGAKRAANVLINHSEKLKYTFAAVVGKEKVIKAPVTSSGIKVLTVQTEEGISEQKQNKESKEALEKQAPVVNLKDQDKKVVSKTPETKTTSKNQTETEETKTKEMEESTDKNSFLNNANKAPKDNQLTPVTSKSGPRTVKNSQRLTDFWWLIPLVIVLGAGLWWIKKKRRPY
ncbi:hypothetical protein HY02_10235 [Peptococcaceae bacterium SCADC1_2_3]|jgi:hypothetical protein|nr:hypothetical protein DK28_0203050 [Peptococcaceae bacterium SCADC1_2_3]KFI38012.1 hypothetical protein HY02_10235 [Peptococcaceae bacterium SCADC1_2_3]